MCCLTINDLVPLENQPESRQRKQGLRRSDADPISPGHSAGISVERTRSIIDQCVVAYLKARCHPRVPLSPDTWRALSPTRNAVGANHRLSTLRHRPSRDDHDVSAPASASSEMLGQSAATSSLTAADADESQTSSQRTDDSTHKQQLAAAGVEVFERNTEPPLPSREPPKPPNIVTLRPPPGTLHPSDGLKPGRSSLHARQSVALRPHAKLTDDRIHYDRVKTIFKPLEDYLLASFGEYQCLNKSFITHRRPFAGRTRSESNIPKPPIDVVPGIKHSGTGGLSELDAKTLLLGDIGENGSWWTGRTERHRNDDPPHARKSKDHVRKAVSSRSPNINWQELSIWYGLIHTAGTAWRTRINDISAEEPDLSKAWLEGEENAGDIDSELSEAKEHALRTLLKLTENVLKRPSRQIKEPEDARFLMILLSNPSLYKTQHNGPKHLAPRDGRANQRNRESRRVSSDARRPEGTSVRSEDRESLPHSGLLKRIFGLLANSTETCHRYLIGWFTYLEEHHLIKIIDLTALFITYRISHVDKVERRGSGIDDGGLIPDLSGTASNTSAQLLNAMGLSGSTAKKRGDGSEQEPHWADDWQLKGAAKVMSLLFAANNIWHDQPRGMPTSPGSATAGTSVQSSKKGRRSGQLLHTSNFYNLLLDFYDMIADFKTWESKREKFAFCQYPLFLSMGTKIKILEYDARRQMEIKAREAYFDQVVRQRVMDGQFHLRIRRECIVDDSLRQISEAVGTGQEELKKGLRVHFTGEEGVDAGGPRKEWFLVLVRDIFDPNHGMFVYDEDSNLCYFNPNSFETSDQYYLVGALLGLAIYNSTILDVAFPSFVFRKLLASAPISGGMSMAVTGTKASMTYTIADLAEFRPKLATGLQQLLDFDGDVETTYCWDFVASQERFGQVVTVPLKPNGENIPVTNANRHEFVDTYVRYLLDSAVARQFEPFKRGFFTVCAGNALSLFRAEEIEMLVRGSEETLNVDLLLGVAVHENWKESEEPHRVIADPAETVPVVGWFWDAFREASPEKQRQLLTFITGSDRIPALGATSLVLRIVAGGDGWGGGGEETRRRFPIARTCFNMLVLWHYETREQLEEKLWRAINESEGFALK
jgi:E3 ubiquitin-protein ligase HECTD2